MVIKSFEDIIGWKKSNELTLEIYRILRFSKDYSFKDQIQRASVSIMNNIAEGYERMGNREFKKFLYIAKGSSGEVRSMLYIGKELHYVSESEFNVLYKLSIEISKVISGLIKSL